MSSAEFFEWAEFYRQEPFGDMRADFRNAMLCSVVANTYGKKKTKVSDFMVFLDKSVDSGASTVARIHDAFGKAASKLKKHVIVRRRKRDGQSR